MIAHKRALMWLGQSLAIGGLACQPCLAATGTITAQIVAVGHTVGLPSQPNGYVYIRLSERFTLAGSCAYSGTIDAPANWILRIDSGDASYRGLLATADLPGDFRPI